jgi:hypothetical protein
VRQRCSPKAAPPRGTLIQGEINSSGTELFGLLFLLITLPAALVLLPVAVRGLVSLFTGDPEPLAILVGTVGPILCFVPTILYGHSHKAGFDRHVGEITDFLTATLGVTSVRVSG